MSGEMAVAVVALGIGIFNSAVIMTYLKLHDKFDRDVKADAGDEKKDTAETEGS